LTPFAFAFGFHRMAKNEVMPYFHRTVACDVNFTLVKFEK
jgi:hypothetical protein